jgi:hypothetical protein
MRRARAWLGAACLVAACGGGGGGNDDGPGGDDDPGDGTEPPGDSTVTVSVSSPAAGAQLIESEHPTIVVAGSVTVSGESAGEPEAWVNGVRAPVQADGSFSTELSPVPGINHILIEGGDGLGPLVPAGEMDVLWASDYLAPVAGTTGFEIAGALELSLGQRFLDLRAAGTTLDLTTDPVVADDLASAVELILWHIDLASLLEGGIQIGEGDSSIDITVPSVLPENILVDARIVDSPDRGILLDIDLLDVSVEMEGFFQFAGNTLVIAGGIAADMHASARLSLSTGPDGAIEVGVEAATATVGPLSPGFTGPDGDELDALIALGGNDFRLLIENAIAEVLIPTFTERGPPILEALLGAADDLLDDLDIELDPGFGRPVLLQLDGQLGALEVVPGPPIGSAPGHVTVRQDLSIVAEGLTEGEPVHPASRGAPRLDLKSAAPDAATAGVRLAIRLDLFNALLHSLWDAGLLEGQGSFAGLSAEVSAKLPPVVRPTPQETTCTIEGERCDVTLQLGQVEVTLPDAGQSFAVSASAGARIAIDGATVSILVQPVPAVRVWEISEEPGTLPPAAVEELIADVAWPALFGAIGENLTVALPLPDLAELGLADLAPGLATASLELVTRRRPTVSGGMLVLDADILLETPPPGSTGLRLQGVETGVALSR